MAFESRKRNHVQVGLSDEVLTELTILTARIGREIGMRRLTRAQVATWALHHLLTAKFNDAVEIVLAGRAYEEKCLRGGESAPGGQKLFAGQSTVGRHVPVVAKGGAKRRALRYNKNAETAV